ncbi:hypothetical protein V8G54_023258 [Vigna mungo]|uniref:Uncharacterized protein n=1 Tax=Vigna mungo TaxID=3915 RepID=A0AAQ3N4R4_VIGMU
MEEAKEKIKLHLARALVEMNNTQMIDEKNPELTNEGSSPALGEIGVLQLTNTVDIMHLFEIGMVWWVQKIEVEEPNMEKFECFEEYLEGNNPRANILAPYDRSYH